MSRVGTPTNEKPLDRESRARCWSTRDAYFGCLDGVRIVTPGQEETLPKVVQAIPRDPASEAGSTSRSSWLPFVGRQGSKDKELAPCAAELIAYSRECPTVWFEYFNKQRVLKERQRLTIEEMEKKSKEVQGEGKT